MSEENKFTFSEILNKGDTFKFSVHEGENWSLNSYLLLDEESGTTEGILFGIEAVALCPMHMQKLVSVVSPESIKYIAVEENKENLNSIALLSQYFRHATFIGSAGLIDRMVNTGIDNPLMRIRAQEVALTLKSGRKLKLFYTPNVNSEDEKLALFDVKNKALFTGYFFSNEIGSDVEEETAFFFNEILEFVQRNEGINSVLPTIGTPQIALPAAKKESNLLKNNKNFELDENSDDSVVLKSAGNASEKQLRLCIQRMISALSLSDLDVFSVLLIAIDDFDMINMRYGDVTGNNIIRKFGILVDDFFEVEHYVFKYYGPKYFVILPHVDKKTALKFMNDFKKQIMEEKIEKIALDVSIGIDEVSNQNANITTKEIIEILLRKIGIARSRGRNFIISELASDNAYNGKKVLIADSNLINAHAMQVFLKSLDFDGVLVQDGAKAIEIIDKEKFGLIIVDTHLPKYDGFQVLEHIKGKAEVNETPVLFISAVDNPDSIVKAIEMGARDYIVRPFYPEVLKTKIRSILRRN